tara:strand:+ start:235 stop:450 length:216 start_codon:yes stop_codon:yes gene_type:complete
VEDKKDRFVRIAEKRVNNIIDNFRLLSQCSNTSVYSFDEEQLNKIWKHIDKSYRACKASYNNKSKKKKFKL